MDEHSDVDLLRYVLFREVVEHWWLPWIVHWAESDVARTSSFWHRKSLIENVIFQGTVARPAWKEGKVLYECHWCREFIKGKTVAVFWRWRPSISAPCIDSSSSAPTVSQHIMHNKCREALKAYLVFHNADFPIHIILPVSWIVHRKGNLAWHSSDSEELTPFAITTRYPGEDEEVTKEEALCAMRLHLMSETQLERPCNRKGSRFKLRTVKKFISWFSSSDKEGSAHR